MIGAGAGAGAGMAATAASPSIASVLQEGGHKGDTSASAADVTAAIQPQQHSLSDDDDDDDVNSDDLEYQKSPFDDED